MRGQISSLTPKNVNARFAIFVEIGAFKVGVVVSWLIGAIESADETGGERTKMSLIISL
jgi:hypothetical protein